MEALIVVDMINDFAPGGVLGNPNSPAIVEPIIDLVNQFFYSAKPVFFVNDTHREGDPELTLWGPHAMVGTSGCELIPELEAHRDKGFVLHKRIYSAFNNGGSLHTRLRDLEVDAVTVVGHLTSICIRHTVADAFFLGYKTVVPINAISDVDRHGANTALTDMITLYGTTLI